MYLIGASAFAFLGLVGMLFGIIFLGLFLAAPGESVSLWMALGGILVLNFAIWIGGPFVMDLVQGFTYKMRKVDLEELRSMSPQSADIIEKVCTKYNYSIPKLRIIEDQNPTAYTYGSGRFNARLVVSEGIFAYLDDDEAATVVAHELGHITRRDFIIMSLASTILQCLYTLYVVFTRTSNRDNKKGSSLAVVGIVSYVFYFVGQYILLYLSRVREYGADEFAVRETQNPNGLSSALMKIAYGIAIESKKEGDQKLIKGTQMLGISNLKSADQISSLGSTDNDNFDLPSLPILSRILAFDFVSWWARISEFFSTHPLTGKRVRRINEMCLEFGQSPMIDFTKVEQNIEQHREEARNAFLGDIVAWVSPMVGLVVLIVGVAIGNIYVAGGGLVLFFLAGIYRLRHKYPSLTEGTPATNYLEVMQDFTVSPLRGKPIIFEGVVNGRGVSGSHLSEDFLLKTPNGLVFSNYQSWFPLLGNFFAALFGKIKKLIAAQTQVQVTGWFFRKNTQWIDLARVTPQESDIGAFRSYSFIGGLLGHFLITVLLAGLVFMTGPISQELKKIDIPGMEDLAPGEETIDV